MVLGNAKIWDLRECKDIVIPDGVERIGSYWFWRASIENVMIPASVREIGVEVFCECRKLREVTFKEKSKLTTIGKGAFYCCKLTSV